MIYLKGLGRRLADRRQFLKMEQREVAERANCSEAYISRLETGIVANPKILDLEAVARAVDMPLADLLHGRPVLDGKSTTVRMRFDATAVFDGDDEATGRHWKTIVDVLQALGCTDVHLRETERASAGPGEGQR